MGICRQRRKERTLKKRALIILKFKEMSLLLTIKQCNSKTNRLGSSDEFNEKS
jgi:hypothetical protein